MAQDTKYLNAYIESNFNLTDIFNECADKKDLDELNNWLNSEKYETIMSSKNIEYIIGGLLNDFQSQNNWDIPLDAALEQSKLVYKPVDDGLRDYTLEKISCLKEIIIKKNLLWKIFEDFKNTDFIKNKFSKIFCDQLKKDLKKIDIDQIFFLIKDPFVDEYFEWENIRSIIKMDEEINKILHSLKFQFSDGVYVEGELLYKNLQNKDNLDKYVDAEEAILVESFKTSPQQDKFLLKNFTKNNQTLKKKKRILEKRGSFRTLAVSRMGTALDSIRKISNCSNKSHYAYSYEEIKEMRDALVNKINYEFSKFGFDKDRSLEIKMIAKELIIGLGGAGNNVLNSLSDLDYKNLLLISPDKEIIKTTTIKNKIYYKLEDNKDIISSFENNKEIINSFLKDIDKVHLIGGLGGRFATTLYSVITDFLKSLDIIVNGIVYTPFKMEGSARIEKSKNAIITIKQKVDSIKVIHLQELLSETEKDENVDEFFKKVNEKVKSYLK